MVQKANQMLLDLVKISSKKLDLKSIIQFGSSTYSKNFKDVDLLFVFNDKIIPTSGILDLMKLIDKFEKQNKAVVCDFGGIDTRKRKAKYKITIIPLGTSELHVKHNPHDLSFFKSIKEDKNIIVLYGNNPLNDFDFYLDNDHIFEMLSVDSKHALRGNLDRKINSESLCHFFKVYLRGMLINDGAFRKDELLIKFKNKFGKSIRLPKNSKAILNGAVKRNDFIELLNFREDCLRFLIKKIKHPNQD